MRNRTKLTVGFACLVAMAAGGDALAKSRNRQPSSYSVSRSVDDNFNNSVRGAPGVAGLNQRSWLEPGTKVPVGSTNRYMLQQTYYNRDPIESNQRSWYMQETLPQRAPYNTDVISPYSEGLPLDWP